VGSVGDSYDNALAESIISLYKTELINQQRPWNNLDQVEYATLKWIDWYNNRRLMIGLGDVPPAEYEQAHYNAQNGQANIAWLTQNSLQQSRGDSYRNCSSP
jgi:putative transposase